METKESILTCNAFLSLLPGNARCTYLIIVKPKKRHNALFTANRMTLVWPEAKPLSTRSYTLTSEMSINRVANRQMIMVRNLIWLKELSMLKSNEVL